MIPFKISVIVPVYNMQEYLKDCLNSIINQTFSDLEIIIINDGSSDNSYDIIKEYALKDARIVVINQVNKGLSGARNKGLEIAKGEYIAFIDSDDTVDLNMLEKLYTKVQNHNIDIAVSQSKRVENGKIISKTNLPRNLSKDHLFNALQNSFSPAVYTKIYRKELFIKNRITFPKGCNYEENITTIKLFHSASSVVYLNDTYYNYFKRTNSITATTSSKNIIDIFKVAVDMEKYFIEKDILPKYKQYIFPRIIKILNMFIFNNLIKHSLAQENGTLVNEIKTSNIFNQENISSLEVLYRDQHLSFISNILKLHEQYGTFQFLIDLFPKKYISLLDNASKLEETLVNHLLKHNIKNIIIYGAGQTFKNILPDIIKHNIKIEAILDNNKSIVEEYSYTFITQNSLINYSCPILITSINFATEIHEQLTIYSFKNNINLTIINIHTVRTT